MKIPHTFQVKFNHFSEKRDQINMQIHASHTKNTRTQTVYFYAYRYQDVELIFNSK